MAQVWLNYIYSFLLKALSLTNQLFFDQEAFFLKISDPL